MTEQPPAGLPGDRPPPPPEETPTTEQPVQGWDALSPTAPAPTGDATEYLAANAGRYTRLALTTRLTSAGYPLDTVEAAWAAVDREDAAAGRRDRRGQVSGLIAWAYFLTWLALTTGWLAGNMGQPSPVLALSGVLGLVLLVPGALGFYLTRGSSRLRRAGAGTAVAFTVMPLLILVALAGSCAAIIPPFKPLM
jgi:hypothetical protein